MTSYKISGSDLPDPNGSGAVRQVPAFRRRAFVSDIMTWHYETPERLALHLIHDRRFIPWMSVRGINAFFYIRHTVDSRLKIDAIAPLLDQTGISGEYGGHVIPLLLPRREYRNHPEYFPVGKGGRRNAGGNLCVSNADAMHIVREEAVLYLRQNPECRLLHIWGADVWEGAWCRCARCSGLSPQAQYLAVVNTIAEAAAANQAEVAYLAYHDTLEADPGLRPRSNVSVEWAPRERCYSHAIDDAACDINPRYLATLERNLALFDGRAHVFEYYADSILFGGLACATPTTIVRDLRAYRRLGIQSISCLTFGEHSCIAYPINLEAFARAAQDPDFDPEPLLNDLAVELHPRCSREIAAAWRSIERASAWILTGGGEVMRPRSDRAAAPRRIGDLRKAHAEITDALEAADGIVGAARDRLLAAQIELWNYNREVVIGLAEYIAQLAEGGPQRSKQEEKAIARIADAMRQLRTAALAYEDSWAAYDLEWISELWLSALRLRLGEDPRP